MFREMLRKNKALSQCECVRLLMNEKRGVLSVLGDEDYPYGMPMNHFYNEDDGNIYFHCGDVGHRLEALRKHDKVSFCVFDRGQPIEGHWAMSVKSVIAFGKIEFVEDISIIEDIATKLSLKFTEDLEYIKNEIKAHGHRTVLMRLKTEHICGKQIVES